MPYVKNDPPWAKGVDGAGEDVNGPLGAWISADRLNHIEEGLEAAAAVADEAKNGLAAKANAASLAAKADQSALEALEARIAALEQA